MCTLPLKRDFYLQMCRQEHWNTRTLQARLDSLLFEAPPCHKYEQAPGEATPLGIILCSGKKQE